jgi:hypothetical protein
LIGDDFGPAQVLANWTDILDAGVRPAEVLLLGFGGGPLTAVESGPSPAGGAAPLLSKRGASQRSFRQPAGAIAASQEGGGHSAVPAH